MNLLPHRIAKAAALAAVGLSLFGCATEPANPNAWAEQLQAKGLKLGASLDSIPHFDIKGFDPLDKQHVLLHAGYERRVLATVDIGCLSLPYAHRIAYTSSAGSLTRFDKLLITGHGLRKSCRIESLQAVEKISG